MHDPSAAAMAGSSESRVARIGSSRRRSSRISHMVASEIVRDIVDNDLSPGDRLPTEAEMIAEFDVGRASIREALRILEGYGLIEIRPGGGGGPTVSALRPEDLSRTLSFYFHMIGATYGELLEARLVIEPVMTELAARRQDPAQLDRLRDVLAREEEVSFEDPEHRVVSDRFHYVVAGISGNGVLDLLARSLRILYQTHVSGGSLLPIEERAAVRAMHREIGEAIIRGDAQLARGLMRDHLQTNSVPLAESRSFNAEDRIRWQDDAPPA